MKKFILALVVVLLATPAWASISITVTDMGDGKAAIDYSGTELARAFALDITVDAGTIDAISDFAVGDDNNGYGIFPANFSRYITVDAVTGEVVDWAVEDYTPVAGFIVINLINYRRLGSISYWIYAGVLLLLVLLISSKTSNKSTPA